MPQSKSRRKKAATSPTETVQVSKRQESRRDFLINMSAWGMGGAVLLGGGGAFAFEFSKRMKEGDLSVIGQGKPVIVQIHDPQCRLCAALQDQTREALCTFDESEVYYRVANIRTTSGAEHQRKEGLPHVTLVLYDGDGQRVHVVRGVSPANELKNTFQRYLRLTPV